MTAHSAGSDNGEPFDPNKVWPGKAEGAPEPAPNVDVMLQHLELMFGGDRCAGMLNGKVEISWSDSHGSVKFAKTFGIDELEEAAQHAAEKNAEWGVNVYVGVALRKEDAPADRRTGKEWTLGATAVPVDWDKPGEGDPKAIREKTAFLPPNYVVVTGEYPAMRSHGWWVLEEPLIGVAAIEALMAPMAHSLKGDINVKNADRVMRLAGSQAWAHKPGRIREQTYLVTKFKADGDKPRPPSYDTDRVVRTFQARWTENTEQAPAGSAGPGPSPDDKNPFTGRFDPAALIARIKAGHWHDGMLKLTAHMVGMGWPDWLIEMALDQFDDKTAPHKERPMDLVRQARVKYNKPNPDPAEEFDFSQSPPAALSFIPASSIVIAELERRPWLFGEWLMKGIVSMLVGPGGQGKSMLSIHVALAYAAGMTWANQKPKEPGGAWIWNNEDDLTELKRRVGGTAKHMGIDLKALGDRLLVGSGVRNKHNPEARRLILAVAGERGEVIPTPDVQTVIQIIKDKGIKVLVIDPMVSIHYINENDNGAMQKVMDILLTIASEADCAVVVVHHTAKPGANAVQAGNQNISRGATSVPGASRVLLTVTQMTEDDAKHMMGEEYDEKMRKRCIRIDTGKANMSAPGDDTVFLEKVSVALGNGSGKHLEDDADQIGGLKVADFTEQQHEAKMKEQDRTDRLRSTVADVMKDIAEGGDMKLKEVVTRILLRTTEFGKERSLRDWVEAVIPPASSGGVQVGGHIYHRWQSGHQQTATTLIGKRLVP
jgi:hypothetical protein